GLVRAGDPVRRGGHGDRRGVERLAPGGRVGELRLQRHAHRQQPAAHLVHAQRSRLCRLTCRPGRVKVPGMTENWPRAGTLLASRYLLVELLETGGMAEIWRARDEVLERAVALKLPTGLRIDSLHLSWREAKMAARLSHPNIAAVHDYGEAPHPGGSVIPFVVMELLAGESLAARVERAPLDWREAAAVAAPVADALAAAHAAGVVHRDIKPGNVMLTPTGVKILDFGISAALGEP